MGWLSVIWEPSPYFGATNRTRKDPGDKSTREDTIADAFREYKVSVAVSAAIYDS